MATSLVFHSEEREIPPDPGHRRVLASPRGSTRIAIRRGEVLEKRLHDETIVAMKRVLNVNDLPAKMALRSAPSEPRTKVTLLTDIEPG